MGERAKRMQRKAILALAGIICLFLLAGGLLIGSFNKKAGEDIAEEPPQPVIEYFEHTYVVEATESTLTFFDGKMHTVPAGEVLVGAEITGQIVDLCVTDGVLTSLTTRGAEKISGKVLAVSGETVELEGRGQLLFSADAAVYVLFGELQKGSTSDIRIGYDYADFILENGQIVATLLTRDETMENIRVLIKNSNYEGNYHQEVSLSCDTDFVLSYEKEGALTEELHVAGEILTIGQDSTYFSGEEKRLFIRPSANTGKVSLLNVTRNQGTPAYRGSLEIVSTENGLAVINEVLLEEYLYAVVPSEMPASYPIEALKAQAICARTYAYTHMINPGLPGLGAHVDDSTAYQVYNNILEQANTTTAVKETAGELLYVNGTLIDTYYYSTSCGFGTDERVWNPLAEPCGYLVAQSISETGASGGESVYTAESMQKEETFAEFLANPVETDFEREEAWHRWTYEVTDLDADKILGILKERAAVNEERVLVLQDGEYVSARVEELGDILDIRVEYRGVGGVAQELVIEGTKNTYKVITESNIRYVLCDGTTQAIRQDGTAVDMAKLLPSAFFVIKPVRDGENVVGYTLTGGGYGHGAGMSQNGAKNMALAGYTATDILSFFYKGCNLMP